MTTVLDEIQSTLGWNEVPLRAVGVKVSNVGYPNLEPLSVFLDAGVVPRSSREDNHNQLGESLEKYQRVLPNDLVFNKLRTWQGGFGKSEYEGIVSPAYIIVRLNTEVIHPKFLEYLLKSKPYLAELTRLSKWMPPTQFDISWESLRDLRLRFPPIEEQHRIADYLDVETKRIQDLITLKKKLVTKYDELFNSVRNYIVVGKSGLGNIKNGEEWFSSVPSHWTKKPLRLLFSWQKGKDPARLDATYCGQNPGPFPVYSGQTANDGIFGEIDTYDFDYKVECNLITTVGARAGSMKVLTGKFSLSQNCALLEPKSEEMSASYLNFLWPTIWNDLSSKIPSDMQPSVRLDDLKKIWVYFPPKEEQSEIVFKLQQMESEYLVARSAVLASIDLYNEYINAIVTEKVTGRFSESKARAVF